MSDLKQYRIRASSAAELVEAVEAAVACGDLAPGQRLPSVRRLAAEVGLSPGTVSAGISELRRRGVVVSEARRGTRIGEGPPIGSLRAPLPVPDGARDVSRGDPDPPPPRRGPPARPPAPAAAGAGRRAGSRGGHPRPRPPARSGPGPRAPPPAD